MSKEISYPKQNYKRIPDTRQVKIIGPPIFINQLEYFYYNLGNIIRDVKTDLKDKLLQYYKMENEYEKLMSDSSDRELLVYLNKVEQYTEPAVWAAVRELEKRGRQFSEKEVEEIKEKIEAKKNAKIIEESIPVETPSWTKNIVKEEAAPSYYSQRTIWAFSIIFSVIFGAVLLSSNFKDRDIKWSVLAYGIFYTILTFFLLSLLPRNTAFTLAANGIGGYVMLQIFWNRYIGAETQYQAKPIWKPLIISILITIPIVWVVISGAEK